MKTMNAERHTYLQKTYDLMDTAGQLAGLKEDGFALVPKVLIPAEVEETKAEIDALRAFNFDRDQLNKVGAVDHFKCVFNRDPYWLPLLDRPGVIELAEASMGEDCHVIGMTAWRSHPNPVQSAGEIQGLSPNGIHTDQNFFQVKEELLASGEVELPIMLCTAHYYLSDITIDLCPTWVIPGSHKSGGPIPFGAKENPERLLEWRGNKIQPVLVKAGDVLFFRSEIWHAGSRNRTEADVRYLLQVHYGRRMIAQKFSPYLNFHFNQEVVSQASHRQRRLLGEHRQSAYD